MRILVTGVNGQLGSELTRTLSNKGHTVIGTARDLASLPKLPNVSYLLLDLIDKLLPFSNGNVGKFQMPNNLRPTG